MRNTFSVASGLVIVSGLIYSVVRPAPVSLAPAKSETREATAQNVDSRVVAALQRQNQDSQLLRADQNGMRAEIAALGERIDGVAAVANKPEQPSASAVPKKQTEASVAEWLDDTLPREWDAERTRNVTATLTTLLKSAGGVHLSTAECGSRFCRAVLTTDDGKMPSMATVLGEPTMAQEGFSVRGNDGATTVYFTPPGGSLSSLRNEALANQPPG